MYRLLLVTDKNDIRNLYEKYPEWENLGFERPVVVGSAQQGIDQMAHHRCDTVSWLFSVKEAKTFYNYIYKRTDVMGMSTQRDVQHLRREISNTRRALASRDALRQIRQGDEMATAFREEFFLDLLRGTPYDKAKIDGRSAINRDAGIHPEWPVCMATFRLPDGDSFLAEVWKYGRDRLENALCNIFENGSEEYEYTLLMINPHHLRLLSVPRSPKNEDDVYASMLEHLHHCESNLENYFELSMNIRRVVSYGNLYALGEENARRNAH